MTLRTLTGLSLVLALAGCKDGKLCVWGCDDAPVVTPPACTVSNGGVEICEDGVDQDCSGSDLACANPVDCDVDGDGFDATSCNGGNDCRDDLTSVHPGATEVCGDGLDNDCSGGDATCETPRTWYRDADSDGHGDAGNTTQSVNQPSGYVTTSDDCDDTGPHAADRYPGNQEICGDAIDQDCSGADLACDPTDPDPMSEICNGLDDDGDGFVDEAGADIDADPNRKLWLTTSTPVPGGPFDGDPDLLPCFWSDNANPPDPDAVQQAPQGVSWLLGCFGGGWDSNPASNEIFWRRDLQAPPIWLSTPTVQAIDCAASEILSGPGVVTFELRTPGDGMVCDRIGFRYESTPVCSQP